MKNPSSIIKFAIFALIAYGVVSAIMDENSQSPTSAEGPTLSSLPSGQRSADSYAMKPLNDNWPQFQQGQQTKSQLADDLLAVNYYVVLDGSGSMRDTDCSDGRPKIDAAREALTAFAQSLPADVNLGLLAFDTQGVSERLPLGPNNQQQFTQAAAQVVANRDTPLGNAIGQAYHALEQQGRKQLGYGEYHLVIITDGKASPGQDPTPVVHQILNHAPVVFHTIGFCINDNHSLNQPGRTYYQSANDPASLSKGLKDVLAEAPSFSVSEFAAGSQ